MDSQYKLVRKKVSKRVDVQVDSVTTVDPQNREVRTESGMSYHYDYLVIASGARYVPDKVDGYAEAAHHFHNGPATLKLREELKNFEGGNIVMGIADLPFKCPVSPLEFVFMAHHYFKKRKMLDKVKIHLTSPLPRAFSIEKVSNKVQKMFDKMGVEVHTFFNTEEIYPEEKYVESMEGDELNYDLLVMVPPHMGQQFVIDSGLAEDSDGWLPVDRETLQHDKYPNIYGVGDCTNLPVSKAGAAAHHQAKKLAVNIANLTKGKAAKKKYGGEVQCFLMTGLNQSLFLDFSYKHPPRSLFLVNFWPIKKFWYVAKKLFKPIHFTLVLKGRI